MTKIYGARTVSARSPWLASKRSYYASTKTAPTHIAGPASVCKDINEWLQPKCHAYRGLIVQRPMERHDIQQQVDNIARSGAFGEENALEEEVDLHASCVDGEADFALDLSKKARRLADFVVQHGLPKDLAGQIQRDLEQIAVVLRNLVPTARQMLLKLDIMGENACFRWHRDRYVGRAVVSYNSCGTLYADNDNVNLWQLENGGSNLSIIRDLSQVFSANIGDILFMKGSTFPGAPNGLVHRSPPPCWHADGSVVNRLLLKVDLN